MRNQTQQQSTTRNAKPDQPVNAVACADNVEKVLNIKPSNHKAVKKVTNKPSKEASTPTGNFNFVGLAG